MNDTIIKALFDWFDSSDVLSPDYPLGVDNLGEDAQQYCIEVVPCTPVIKKYVDGSSKNQYLFIFASREYYSEDECNNMKNLKFYEKLEGWIENQSLSGNLPQLPTEHTAQSVEVLSSGYVLDNDTKTARYQIQCRLKYIKQSGGLNNGKSTSAP